MNWRRGLFRLWLVLASLWLLGSILFGRSDLFFDPDIFARFLAFGLLPPIGALFLGISIAWAISGFQSAPRRKIVPLVTPSAVILVAPASFVASIAIIYFCSAAISQLWPSTFGWYLSAGIDPVADSPFYNRRLAAYRYWFEHNQDKRGSAEWAIIEAKMPAARVGAILEQRSEETASGPGSLATPPTRNGRNLFEGNPFAEELERRRLEQQQIPVGGPWEQYQVNPAGYEISNVVARKRTDGDVIVSGVARKSNPFREKWPRIVVTLLDANGKSIEDKIVTPLDMTPESPGEADFVARFYSVKQHVDRVTTRFWE